MNTNGEDELRGLLQAACKPVVASLEFREQVFKRLTQEVSRQAIQPPRPLGRQPIVLVSIDACDSTRELTRRNSFLAHMFTMGKS